MVVATVVMVSFFGGIPVGVETASVIVAVTPGAIAAVNTSLPGVRSTVVVLTAPGPFSSTVTGTEEALIPCTETAIVVCDPGATVAGAAATMVVVEDGPDEDGCEPCAGLDDAGPTAGPEDGFALGVGVSAMVALPPL